MEGEEWRDVVGYERIYKVSDYGRIKSLPRCRPTDKRKTHNNIRKAKKRNNGYYCINLSKGSETKWKSLHRIVAQAFIDNTNNYPIINHKDENPANNCAYNLEWCTYRYNRLYGNCSLKQKLSRANNPNDKYARKLVGIKNSKAVRCFTPDGVFVAIYQSLSAASEATGVHITQISRHCNGKVGNEINRPIRKFRFEYAD